MDIDSLRFYLLTITDTITDITFFLWNRMDVGSFVFFSRNVPFLTSVVFLTLHDTLLTTRRRRGFNVLLFFVFFFCDGLAQCSECQRGENFKTSAGERQE